MTLHWCCYNLIIFIKNAFREKDTACRYISLLQNEWSIIFSFFLQAHKHYGQHGEYVRKVRQQLRKLSGRKDFTTGGRETKNRESTSQNASSVSQF